MTNLKHKFDALRAQSVAKRLKLSEAEEVEEHSSEESAEDDAGILVPGIPSPEPAVNTHLDAPSPEPAVEGHLDTSTIQGATSRFAPPKKSRSKVMSTPVSKNNIDVAKEMAEKWMAETKLSKKVNRSDQQRLSHPRSIIQQCIAEHHSLASNHEEKLAKLLDELRDEVQKIQFYAFLTPALVKGSKIMDEKGLLALIDGEDCDIFPYDIRADAEELWLRWSTGDVDPSLLRGIDVTKEVKSRIDGRANIKRTNKTLSKSQKTKSCNVVGGNGLINGQWWPLRVCAFRDGAHGELEAGIHGQADKGAYSVVIASGGYADRDNGETVEYCGTESSTSKPTKSTTLMQEAFAKNQVLRVLRGVNKKSVYAPKFGLRYDGLYRITHEEELDKSTSMYRFTLNRVEGQAPIRYEGLSVRPNKFEIAEHIKIRDLLA